MSFLDRYLGTVPVEGTPLAAKSVGPDPRLVEQLAGVVADWRIVSATIAVPDRVGDRLLLRGIFLAALRIVRSVDTAGAPAILEIEVLRHRRAGLFGRRQGGSVSFELVLRDPATRVALQPRQRFSLSLPEGIGALQGARGLDRTPAGIAPVLASIAPEMLPPAAAI